VKQAGGRAYLPPVGLIFTGRPGRTEESALAAILVFTLVRSVLLRPLPVRDQQQLILAWRDVPASGYAHYPFDDRAIAHAAADVGSFAAVAGVDARGGRREVLVEDGAATTVAARWSRAGSSTFWASRRCSAGC
jgi:hypothetical protein